MRSRFTSARFFLERVVGVVLRDDRGVSPHQLVSRVVLVRTPRVLVSPANVGVVLDYLFWTVLLYIYYLLLFYLFCVIIFIHLAFCTHVSLCVRSGTNHS
jgi:hypothetical protein